MDAAVPQRAALAGLMLLCLCDAKFTGEGAVRYGNPPAVGDTRRCMLLVRDAEADVPQILNGLGWESLGVATRPIEAAEFDTPAMQPFRQHYEACLKDGYSLVWFS